MGARINPAPTPLLSDRDDTRSVRLRAFVGTLQSMAVVIASSLRKELAGSPLFDGVSFRRAPARPARALRAERGRQDDAAADARRRDADPGGELAFAKGTRVALHDQRPPLEQELSLREYVALRRRRPRRARGGAARARAGDGRRRPRPGDAAPLRARRRRGSSTPAATAGATARRRSLRGLGFVDARPRPAARDVLRRRADARLARARARRRSRPAAARRADEPPRRREPRVARARAARRSTPR